MTSSIRELSLTLGLDDADDGEALKLKVGKALGRPAAELPDLYVVRRSIDARRGRVRFELLLSLEAPAQTSGPLPRGVTGPRRVVVVGAGPAGLFCAYQLARRGIPSLVVDRGKRVQPRRHDLKALNARGVVNPECNYCFGEGGAGTYSDGKLYTRSHKRGNVRDVLEVLALHGAPQQILVDARPHIGSNRLPVVVTALRERLEAAGVEFLFESRVVDLLAEGQGALKRVVGVALADGKALTAEAVVLATGHSARDVIEMLLRHEVALEPKPFALGVRIEHPQPLINEIQYGRAAGHPKLPAAYYRCASTVQGRGVYSFCMCPGGFIVPASTEVDGLVLNGMSLSKRDSRYANSGLVIAIEPDDLEQAGYSGIRGGMEFQRQLEVHAFRAGGGALRAPAARATDFVARRVSSSLPQSSYIPGVSAGDLHEVLDAGGIRLAERLSSALQEFDRRMRGYLSEEAMLLGVESRSSSPVRVLRDSAALESPSLARLFPCAEGAGYAGGIVSAALDGMRVAERLAERYFADFIAPLASAVED